MANPVGLGTLVDSAAGLMIKGELDLDTQSGRDAYSRLKKGIVRGLSIGYSVTQKAFEDGVRKLKEIDLFEVSLVAVPMNPAAQVTLVKSGVASIRDYERFLHQAGWSKSEACKLAGHGWKGLMIEDEDSPILLEWLREQNRVN